MSKTLLITGATGKQGGAVINALIAFPSTPPVTIFALTRNPASAAAKGLVAKSPTVKLVTGDLDRPTAIFATATTPIWGVFSVQIFRPGRAGAEREERQSKALIDAALENGVKHFVYSSVDRHGARSDSDATNVPQFATKHRSEKYLQEKAAGTNMTWTILRPVAFMENFTPGFVGKVSAAMWKFAIPATKPLQLVATADISYFAVQAFLNSDVGSAADIVELRKMHPGLMTFGDWLEKESVRVRRS